MINNMMTYMQQTEIFRTHPVPALGPIRPPIQWVPAISQGVKQAGVWHSPATPSRAEVKERVALNLYSTSAPSWPVIG